MTGSAADLRDLGHIKCAYALRIEGCPVCFVTNANLADGTWLTEHPTVLDCLHPPRLPSGINPRTGAFRTADVTFEIEDVDDSLVDLFAAIRSDVTPLQSTLAAGSTAAPAALFSKHVGVEAISSAGARMQYPFVPNYSIGYQHTGELGASTEYQPIAPVSDDPFVWAGRRCAVLRVFHNEPSAGTDFSGVNWTAPANSDIAWVGTLQDEGTVKGKTWELGASGVQSLISRPIGQDSWTDGVAITDSASSFNEDEDYVGCYFVAWGNNYFPIYEYGEDKFTAQFADATIASIRTGITNAISTALADSGTDGLWSDDGGSAGFNTTSHRFTVDYENPDYATPARRMGVMAMVMHEKAWAKAGYDPAFQGSLDPSDPKFVAFRQYDQIQWPSGTDDAPTGGYWVANFVTGGYDWEGMHTQPIPYEEAQHRVYQPQYQGGTVVLEAQTPYEIEISHLQGEAFLYLSGQHDAAPASDPEDLDTAYTIADSVGDVDKTRLFLVYGPRVDIDGDGNIGEPYTESQIFRCSWQDASGKIQESGTSIKPRLVVHAILEPRLFGIDRPKLDRAWNGLAAANDASNSIYIVPLTHIGAFDEYPDPIGEILQRIMLTTGTGTGWTGFYRDPGTLDVGDNEPDHDEPNPQYKRDYETYPMGLAIPKSLVQTPGEFRKQESRLPESLRVAKLAYVGQVSAEDVMLGLMQPLGLCFHQRNGKVGVFNPWDILDPSQADIAISSESYSAGTDPKRALPKQSLRVFSPIDTLKLQWDWHPLEGSTQHETVYQSIDPGRRYRATPVEHTVQGHGLRLGQNWNPDLFRHWKRGFEWWARRHFKIKVRLQRSKGQLCWPGTIVRYTDNWVVNPDGTYGVTNHVGFITSCTYDCAAEVADVEILVQDNGGAGFRFYAPMARVYHYDGTNFVLYCHDDWLDVGYGHNDVTWFAEPSWSGLGGSADIELLQYNGTSWTGGIFGTVTSVNAEAGNTYIQLDGALTGATFYDQKPTIAVMRDAGNQTAAWVLGLFAPTADEDGLVDGAAANAVKFNGL